MFLSYCMTKKRGQCIPQGKNNGGEKSSFSLALEHLLLAQLFHCKELGWCPKVLILQKINPFSPCPPQKNPANQPKKAPPPTKQKTQNKETFSHI